MSDVVIFASLNIVNAPLFTDTDALTASLYGCATALSAVVALASIKLIAASFMPFRQRTHLQQAVTVGTLATLSLFSGKQIIDRLGLHISGADAIKLPVFLFAQYCIKSLISSRDVVNMARAVTIIL